VAASKRRREISESQPRPTGPPSEATYHEVVARDGEGRAAIEVVRAEPPLVPEIRARERKIMRGWGDIEVRVGNYR
jgi:hypothetical protein